MKRIGRRCLGLAMCLVIAASLYTPVETEAATRGRVLVLAQAQNMALVNNPDIMKLYNQIILKQVQYKESIKEAKEKVRTKKTFSWMPLLSFHFPEQLNLTDEYDTKYKPTKLQAEITTKKHEYNDARYEALKEVTDQFNSCYVLQEKITFVDDRLKNAKIELEKNQGRLVLGDAKQADIDAMKSNVKGLEEELTTLMTNFENAKKALSDTIRMDVTSSFRFRSGLKTANIPRTALEDLVQQALNSDHGVYSARMTESTALMTLNAYDTLMKNQYGGKMNLIESYVNMVKNGLEIDSAGFQLKYDQLIKDVDSRWEGKRRILFFSFRKDWFKGDIDGVRYIEDDAYAMFTGCLEYQAAVKDRVQAEKDLRSEVESTYETLMSEFKSYRICQETVDVNKSDLDKLVELNKLGMAEYSEVADTREMYEDSQIEMMDALKSYNETLTYLDDLTCGAVTKYLKGEGIGTNAGPLGDSLAEIDSLEWPYYYIYAQYDRLMFVLGVHIPEDFKPGISHYEVWYEDTQLGERMPVADELHHLCLDYGESSSLTLRFYDGDTYVTQCEINTDVQRDILPIDGELASDNQPQKVVIGTYTTEMTTYDNLTMTKLNLQIDQEVGAQFYALTYGEKNIYNAEMKPMQDGFGYISILLSSLEDVNLLLYSRTEELLETAHFDSAGMKVYVLREPTTEE